MNVRKLVGLAVFLALVSTLMVACSGQQGSASSAQGGSIASIVSSSNATVSNEVKEREVRVATTEEDFSIFSKYSSTELYVSKSDGRQIPMGDKLYAADSDVVPGCGYYEESDMGYLIKNLYYHNPKLSILEDYGDLVGSYGDIPVLTLDRASDKISARDSSHGNLVAYKCQLAGCTIGWVDNENAIWNQNDLICVGDPGNLQIVDLSGQSRSNPMDWDFGEELVVKCDGQSHQVHADSYVYRLNNEKIEIAGSEVKVVYDGITSKMFGYDLSKLEPGLYYFEDQGVYKVV